MQRAAKVAAAQQTSVSAPMRLLPDSEGRGNRPETELLNHLASQGSFAQHFFPAQAQIERRIEGIAKKTSVQAPNPALQRQTVELWCVSVSLRVRSSPLKLH